jgi:hypothetical protein
MNADDPYLQPRSAASVLMRIWRVLPWALMLLVGLLAALIWLRPGWLGLAPSRPIVPAPAARPAPPPAPSPPSDLAARLDRLEQALASQPPSHAGPAPPLPPPQAGLPADAPGRLQALEAELRRLTEREAATSSRLAALVAELEAAGLSTGGIASTTAQARDLFVLGATRRHIEQGRPLGPLEAALRQQFGLRDPSAIEALAAWSRAPISRRLLEDRLGQDNAGTSRPETSPGSFWSRLRNQFAGLVTLRRADGPDPALRQKAEERLAAGDLEGAITLLASAPASPDTATWLEDARRLAAAESGLDRLELLAIQLPLPQAQPASTP